MNGFKLTILAREDLKNIGRYTQVKWGRVQRNKYLSLLDSRFYWLAENPLLGNPRKEINVNYRSWKEGEHVIFYRIKGDDIEILGLIGPGMMIQDHLRP